jgi:hypothetical protein
VRLLSDYRRAFDLLKARIAIIATVARTPSETTIAGPGRVDAFGTARNLIFGPATARPPNAPVSYPHLFNVQKTTWLHWDGNTNSAMERNMGQAIGLGAVVDASFESTLLPRDIHALELLVNKITAPKWPGKIEPNKALEGKKVFERLCNNCHGPSVDPPDVMSLSDIGTARERAESFAHPVGTRKNEEALAQFLGDVKRKAYARAGISADEEKTMEGKRFPPQWRAPKGYAQRPLLSVWATAPYLHNGSVPSIAELLKPAAQRIKKFKIGTRNYDPKTLGYENDGPTEIDTTEVGNGNGGHTGTAYGTDLSPTEKDALIEYLKQL